MVFVSKGALGSGFRSAFIPLSGGTCNALLFRVNDRHGRANFHKHLVLGETRGSSIFPLLGFSFHVFPSIFTIKDIEFFHSLIIFNSRRSSPSTLVLCSLLVFLSFSFSLSADLPHHPAISLALLFAAPSCPCFRVPFLSTGRSPRTDICPSLSQPLSLSLLFCFLSVAEHSPSNGGFTPSRDPYSGQWSRLTH